MRATWNRVGAVRSVRRYGCAPAGFTNLRGKVYVWAPFSPTEFEQLPRARHVLKRCYRIANGRAYDLAVPHTLQAQALH